MDNNLFLAHPKRLTCILNSLLVSLNISVYLYKGFSYEIISNYKGQSFESEISILPIIRGIFFVSSPLR